MSYDPNTQPEPQPAPAPPAYAAPLPPAEAYPAASDPYAQTSKPALPTTLAHTNAYALVAVILAFIMPIAAIVFGHMGLSQIKRNGDSGRGLALTGLIIGYAYVVIIGLVIITYIGVLIVMFASLGAAMGGFDPYNSSW